MKRRNRSKKRAILSSPFTLVAAIILFVFLGRASARIHTKSMESAARLSDASANLVRLEEKSDTLKTKIDSLSTQDGVEASIREKYHAVEPGEQVAVIINKDDSGVPDTAAAEESAPKLSLWQRFLQAIGF